MNINPMQFINQIRSGQNPQQLMLNFLEQQANNNPMGQNLLNLARNNQTQDIEQFARNMFASNGRDFDSEFKKIQRYFWIII